MANFSRSLPPLAPTSLEAVEKRLNVSLPADYRTFLLTTNGGIPDSNHHFNVPDRGAVMLGALYGVGPERTALDLEHAQEQATMWGPLRPGDIVVGEDPGGNLLLLSTLAKDAGHIWFWDRIGIWVREDDQHTFPVAKSFADFFESLRAE